ncbi:ATP-binding protein [Paraburkholderia nemoris]|uniref:AlbA family DNA-binding domain-containing protein n=1 Tax=Paraburkholderia nemoris TaxID=2793076 RepID=UPI0038B8449D
MFDTLESIQALIGVEAESVSLEFKDGTKLDGFTDRVKTEVITDVTAFANAGGGTVIYGIREEQRDGQSLASAISPVTDPAVTQDRLRDIIHSNTDPALRGFSITTIAAEGGWIFVIEVAEGDTAYQNKRDLRFYNRVDASAHPMYAFAVRDVMNRRTRPHVSVNLQIRRRTIENERHVYAVVPELRNEGNLTANHWTLRLGVPAVIGRPEGALVRHMRSIGELREGNHRTLWFEYSSEQIGTDTRRILPGDSLQLDMAHGYPEVLLVISGEAEIRATQFEPPIFWSLLLDNAPRQSGELQYREWSIW